MKQIRWAVLGWMASVAVWAAPAVPDAAFDAWVESFTAEWRAGSGAAATQTPAGGAPAREAAEDDNDGNPLEGLEVRRAHEVALARRGLERLGEWPDERLAPAQRISAAVLRWNLELVVARQPFADHQFVFRQLRGLHVSLVDTLTERTTVRRPADVPIYLARLGRVAPRLDEGIARTRAAVKRGLIPPRFIVERSLQQLDQILAPVPEKNIFVTALEGRLAALKNGEAAARTDALEKARAIVAADVIPAYTRVRDLLRELLPLTTDAAGISRLPDGPAAYEHALRTFTTTTLSAEEIHAIGLREVARLEREMDVRLRALGHTDGTVNERFGRLAAGNPLPAEPDPRAAMIARYTEIIRDAEKRSAALFNLKPVAPVEVRRVPPLTERTASAYYTMPAADGSRPGIFWAPLPGPTFFFGPRMRSLAYHEAVPGHHFQLAIQLEQKDLPRFRARRTFGSISAHSEGWGLYAERLAVEQGWYEGDPLGHLGALSSELFRARRLVVDTGLHAKGWTRQQAIDYGISAQEVERYVVNPGQACSYMIGLLRILDYREKAKAALGPRFSLPAFHDVVLKTGSVPLDVLGRAIDAWIADEKAAPARG